MTGKKKQRIDLAQGDETLTDNPFAALGGIIQDAPDQASLPKKAEIVASKPAYQVARSRKGNWPVRIENRGGGKVVTILESVSGDGKTLLKALQKSLGTGGKFSDNAIQIQGDHVEHIENYLNDHLE